MQENNNFIIFQFLDINSTNTKIKCKTKLTRLEILESIYSLLTIPQDINEITENKRIRIIDDLISKLNLNYVDGLSLTKNLLYKTVVSELMLKNITIDNNTSSTEGNLNYKKSNSIYSIFKIKNSY